MIKESFESKLGGRVDPGDFIIFTSINYYAPRIGVYKGLKEGTRSILIDEVSEDGVVYSTFLRNFSHSIDFGWRFFKLSEDTVKQMIPWNHEIWNRRKNL
jgi:hypothetical protein